MKIRLLSDLHHEFNVDKGLYKTKGEDVLVIAGDLNVGSYATTNSLLEFYEEQKNIIYVPGNHENYGTSIADFNADIRAATRGTGIKFLNPGSMVLDGVAFIGATLWTNFRKDALAKFACSQGINDFRRIKHFSTDCCEALHTEHFKYIKSAYSVYEYNKKVIISHFLPAVECISAQYRGPDLINYYYANDYGDWISNMSNTTWLFGHTHDNVDMVIGDTRCVCNPYGYYNNPNYKEMIIEI